MGRPTRDKGPCKEVERSIPLDLSRGLAEGWRPEGVPKKQRRKRALEWAIGRKYGRPVGRITGPLKGVPEPEKGPEGRNKSRYVKKA